MNEKHGLRVEILDRILSEWDYEKYKLRRDCVFLRKYKKKVSDGCHTHDYIILSAACRLHFFVDTS